jgi:hypothetical protein
VHRDRQTWRHALRTVLATLASACVLAAVGTSWVGASGAAAEVIHVVNVPSKPMEMAPDGTHLWMTEFEADAAAEIDPTTDPPSVLRTVPVGHLPTGVAFGVTRRGPHLFEVRR